MILHYENCARDDNSDAQLTFGQLKSRQIRNGFSGTSSHSATIPQLTILIAILSFSKYRVTRRDRPIRVIYSFLKCHSNVYHVIAFATLFTSFRIVPQRPRPDRDCSVFVVSSCPLKKNLARQRVPGVSVKRRVIVLTCQLVCWCASKHDVL